ncbi:ATP-binding cassette sub-family B member 10, mitochondrial-like [Saccostrea echinata]|uniref:ATP-binding cassette sub-family B member 10, mitochondrial-like n=1 Tax=Saccostrea echinata TaxID=191078 RepID=UPI002A8312DD|nr:ATP-binding cassette sub-family B member 10, mitochondrial-like [Saccostrea echinata]
MSHRLCFKWTTHLNSQSFRLCLISSPYVVPRRFRNTFYRTFRNSLVSKSNILRSQNVSTGESTRNSLFNKIKSFVSRRKSSSTTLDKNHVKKKVPTSEEIYRLLSLAKSEKWKLAGAVGLLIISSGISMSIPFCIGKVIDTIYSDSENMTATLTNICQILICVFIIGAIANMGRIYIMNNSGNIIVKNLREKLFLSIVRQEVGFFDKNRTGELINRLSTDTSLVGRSITMNVSDGLRAVAQAAGGVGMMLYVSPKLTGIVICVVPPLMLVSRYYGSYQKKITKNVQDSLANATQVAEERISNIRTVRAFAQENKEIENYNSKIEHVLQLMQKEAAALGLFWGLTGFTGNLIILSVLYSGGIMMQSSMITVGELSSFLLYAAYATVSLSGMTSFYSELMKGIGASSRIWELTDRVPEIPITGGLVPSAHTAGSIEFSNIVFSYPSRPESFIFNDLSLTVPPGQITAVVGSSGSGKSTLGSLLLRFYDPQEGSVFLDGHDIKTLDPHWLRNQIGTVSQEPVLFSSTIAENIMYGAADMNSVSPAEIEGAARKANALNFIKSFPNGFETIVGERGLMLSGGQRQRIAIARAILKDPKILLLDEATSALDAESEFLVQDALEKLMVDRTVITIAHRLSTIRSANQIAVLDLGAVAEIGPYQELIKIPNGIFRKLVERQTISQ